MDPNIIKLIQIEDPYKNPSHSMSGKELSLGYRKWIFAKISAAEKNFGKQCQFSIKGLMNIQIASSLSVWLLSLYAWWLAGTFTYKLYNIKII